MPRRGENIYKRRDGRWEGRILRGHSPERKPLYTYIYGHTYKEVKQKMEDSRLLTANQLRKAVRISESTMLSDIAQQWLAGKQNTIKESTFAHYKSLVDGHIIPEIGTCSLWSIDDSFVNQYIETLRHQGRQNGKGGLADKTVSDIVTLLKAILKHAGKSGCEIRVDFDEIRVHKQHREMRVLSIEEQNRLAALFDSPTDKRCIGVMISLYTGLRLGEVCALRWENVNLVGRTIHVRETMQRVRNYKDPGPKTKIIITEPKSDCSIREIPIPEFMLPVLQQIQENDDAFVLTGRADKFVEPRSMENYFQRCIKEIGIPPANYHALRHSFATRCVEAGFDIKSLSEILGHSNVKITLDRYVHSSFEQKRKHMNMLTMRICA